jgi:hypothetical protein
MTITATTAKSKRYSKVVWPRMDLWAKGILIDNTNITHNFRVGKKGPIIVILKRSEGSQQN